MVVQKYARSIKAGGVEGLIRAAGIPRWTRRSSAGVIPATFDRSRAAEGDPAREISRDLGVFDNSCGETQVKAPRQLDIRACAHIAVYALLTMPSEEV
jgi:hypothetical protein